MKTNDSTPNLDEGVADERTPNQRGVTDATRDLGSYRHFEVSIQPTEDSNRANRKNGNHCFARALTSTAMDSLHAFLRTDIVLSVEVPLVGHGLHRNREHENESARVTREGIRRSG